jgi:eukaryotic-like serine/threonine-protein kinase
VEESWVGWLSGQVKAAYDFIRADQFLSNFVGGSLAMLLGWAALRFWNRQQDHTATSEQEKLGRRNRHAMIEKVRAIWIHGFLEKSLEQAARLVLGLKEQPDAVVRTLDLFPRLPGQPATRLPSGTQIREVFDTHGGQVLILGAPGAGKTMLLLELARGLLDRATTDDAHPIPVVFPLSSWATQRRPLAEWLVEELRLRYDVPKKVADAWVASDQILPLLDGLDEVRQEHRVACTEAINTYRRSRGLLSLVVCCRVADYEALTTQLQLQGAIAIQPLTMEQVNSYLKKGGKKLAAVQRLLREEPTFGELLDTPLMLNIVTLAYADHQETILATGGTVETRRHHLFATYVDRMFQHRSGAAHYSRERTEHWLIWLAHQLRQHSLSVFYLERLQPDWLPQRQCPWVRRGSGILVILFLQFGFLLRSGLDGLHTGLLFGLAFGLGTNLIHSTLDGVILGLVGGLVIGLVTRPVDVLVAILVFGLPFGLGGRFLNRREASSPEPIRIVETLRWSWPAFRANVLPRLSGGLVPGLLIGFMGVLIGELDDGRFYGLVFGLFFGLIGVATGGWSSGTIDKNLVPNQGIQRSARNAIIGGLGTGFITGLVVWLVTMQDAPGFGQNDILYFGLFASLLGGLSMGGAACLQHGILRCLLVWNRVAPWRYAAFLDYAADCLFLRKVGGGYIFIHRLLLEYFASLGNAGEGEKPSAPPSASPPAS